MRWAPLEPDGWRLRGDGWYANPNAKDWLRSADGKWWSAADVAEARVVMTQTGPERAPGWFIGPDGRWVHEAIPEQDRLPDDIAEIKRRLEEVTGQ